MPQSPLKTTVLILCFLVTPSPVGAVIAPEQHAKGDATYLEKLRQFVQQKEEALARYSLSLAYTQHQVAGADLDAIIQQFDNLSVRPIIGGSFVPVNLQTSIENIIGVPLRGNATITQERDRRGSASTLRGPSGVQREVYYDDGVYYYIDRLSLRPRVEVSLDRPQDQIGSLTYGGLINRDISIILHSEAHKVTGVEEVGGSQKRGRRLRIKAPWASSEFTVDEDLNVRSSWARFTRGDEQYHWNIGQYDKTRQNTPRFVVILRTLGGPDRMLFECYEITEFEPGDSDGPRVSEPKVALNADVIDKRDTSGMSWVVEGGREERGPGEWPEVPVSELVERAVAEREAFEGELSSDIVAHRSPTESGVAASTGSSAEQNIDDQTPSDGWRRRMIGGGAALLIAGSVAFALRFRRSRG